MGIERFPVAAQIEVRAAKDASGKRELVGYAIVYNTRSQDLGGFVEVIAPGAFTASIQADDIRALWNHDDNIVLGRTKSGTLQLADEARGVRFTIDPPASAGQQIESIERGDVDGTSFGFYVDRDAWAMVDNLAVRTVLQARLVEVSPVTFPAYLSSSVGVRSLYGELPAIPESIQRALVEHTQSDGAADGPAGADKEAALETRGSKTVKGNAVQMRRDAAQHLQRANTLDATANAAGRRLTEEEQAEYDVSLAENRRLLEAAQRAEQLEAANPEEVDAGDEDDEQPIQKRSFNRGSPTAKRHYKRGDSERNALLAFIRRGDTSGMMEQRAVVDSTLNITTPSDGGYAVPVDHHNEIVTKRNDMRVADKLGVRKVTGAKVIRESGTITPATATAEEAPYVRDAPQFGEVDFSTLGKYTAKIDITEELEEDNDVNLLETIEDYISRVFAAQHNAQLVAALASGGSTSVSLAGIIAATGHIPAMAAALPDGYADNPKFLMRRATAWAYYALTGNPFQFVNTPPGAGLFGYDVVHTGAVAAIGASAVPLYFADWYFVGLREKGGLTMVRDIYSQDGRTLLKYRQRFKYATIQAEAVLRGTYAAS